MKARTRRLYLVLIGAFAVAAGQEFGSPHAFASRGSLVYAQPLPPTVPSQSAPLPAAQEEAPPPISSQEPSDVHSLPVAPETNLPATPAAPETAAVQEPSAAKTLKEIDVQPQPDGLKLVLKGDGQLAYEVSRVRGNRLVVDLNDVTNGTKRTRISVRHPLLKQVRIGSHVEPERKVRLVLEVPRAVTYTMERDGSDLQIMLTDAAPVPPVAEEAPALPAGEQAQPVKLATRAAPEQAAIRVQAPVSPSLPRLRPYTAGAGRKLWGETNLT